MTFTTKQSLKNDKNVNDKKKTKNQIKKNHEKQKHKHPEKIKETWRSPRTTKTSNGRKNKMMDKSRKNMKNHEE